MGVRIGVFALSLRLGWTGAKHGPEPGRVFLVGWAAVRGSITLATALSIPLLTASGTPFPYRDLVVYLAAAIIILTLALNGVPLPWLVHRLDLETDPFEAEEERLARIESAKAGEASIEQALGTRSQPEDRSFAEQLRREFASRVACYTSEPAHARVRAMRGAVRRNPRLLAIRVQRERLRELRDADRINDETLREIEQELDEREGLAGTAIGRTE